MHCAGSRLVLQNDMTNTVTKVNRDAGTVERMGGMVQSRRDGPTADDRLRRRNGGENSVLGFARPLCWNLGEEMQSSAHTVAEARAVTCM